MENGVKILDNCIKTTSVIFEKTCVADYNSPKKRSAPATDI